MSKALRAVLAPGGGRGNEGCGRGAWDRRPGTQCGPGRWGGGGHDRDRGRGHDVAGAVTVTVAGAVGGRLALAALSCETEDWRR